MNEERNRILAMVAQGKISPEEAATLLDALSTGNTSAPETPTPVANPRYLRVLVDGGRNEQGGKVNVRVPISLIRAGVKLAALLPVGVYDQVNKALKENGVDLDVSKIKPENLEELVQHLNELTVDVEGHQGEKVRVFCE